MLHCPLALCRVAPLPLREKWILSLRHGKVAGCDWDIIIVNPAREGVD